MVIHSLTPLYVNFPLPSIRKMTRRRIHPDLKRTAVRLSTVFTPQVVASILEISDDTVRRAVKQFQTTGDVIPLLQKKGGRKPILSTEEKCVSLYLFCSELQLTILF